MDRMEWIVSIALLVWFGLKDWLCAYFAFSQSNAWQSEVREKERVDITSCIAAKCYKRAIYLLSLPCLVLWCWCANARKRESANAQSQPRMHIYISFVRQAIGAFMNVSRRQYTAYVINFRYFYEILRGISMPLRPDLLIHTISSLTLLNDKTVVMQFNGLSVRVHCLVAECRVPKPSNFMRHRNDLSKNLECQKCRTDRQSLHYSWLLWNSIENTLSTAHTHTHTRAHAYNSMSEYEKQCFGWIPQKILTK